MSVSGLGGKGSGRVPPGSSNASRAPVAMANVPHSSGQSVNGGPGGHGRYDNHDDAASEGMSIRDHLDSADLDDVLFVYKVSAHIQQPVCPGEGLPLESCVLNALVWSCARFMALSCINLWT